MIETLQPLGGALPRSAELRAGNALDSDEVGLPFRMVSQAIVDCRSGSGDAWVECLIRGCGSSAELSPMQIVRQGYARRGGRFDLDVFDACLRLAATLHPGTRIGVNIHPSSLAGPQFVPSLLAAASRARIDPQRIVLELVEFDGPVDLARSTPSLRALRASGVQIALDDFGTGNPNLGLLSKRLVDFIKLDRSLIAGIEHNDGDRNLIRGLVSLAEHTGVGLVAEGIERPGQMRALAGLGIFRMQGFLFHRPGAVVPGLKGKSEMAVA